MNKDRLPERSTSGGVAPEPVAFVFPGQGSQQDGMGADLADHDAGYRSLIADANRLSGIDVTREHMPVPDDTVVPDVLSTVTTQLSVFALSVSLGRILLEGGMRPRAVAGHSLGEYSALVVGGWLDVDDGLEVVARRAAVMERCCAEHDGAMAAVIGLGEQPLRDALRSTGAVLANVNGPKQIVVSGSRPAIDEASERACAAGASAIVELPVAGAFHSPQMDAAQSDLADSVERLPLHRGSIPMVSSITGRAVDGVRAYRRELAGQITAPVRWLDAMAQIVSSLGPGASAGIVEVGPGAVLRDLFRQFDRRRRVATCGSLSDCAAVLADSRARAAPLSG